MGAVPADGVIFVRNNPTVQCPAFLPLVPYTPAANCGDAYISGSYSRGVTVASERDTERPATRSIPPTG